MPIRNGQTLTFRAQGVCDSIDGTNAMPGAMKTLTNLVPNPANRNQFVPRPASTQVTDFTGFTLPEGGEALLIIGAFAWGMIASDRFAGKSEPFCYDLANGVFIAIAGPTAANCPLSISPTGDWEPPTLSMVSNRLMITHPGYDGVTYFVGWIDISSFTSTPATGDTHTNTLVDALSLNPLTSGWQVGQRITGAGIPADTFIVALTATSVTLSQAATATAAGVALTVTGGTPAAPQYGAGQTNGQALIARPVAVSQFNGRAYYAVENGLQFSDALLPLQITNATQAMTLGDNQPVTALGGLPLSNQVQGGLLQALIAFKADDLYYQITGDPATNNLKQDAVVGSVGTLAPNTLTPTPQGLAYVAPDGLRIVGLDGKSSQPIGTNGLGVNVPFLNAVSPTRMCAAFDQNLIRITVQNGAVDGQPLEEYWYDFSLNIWTGPHSFPAALISPYHNGTNDFILFAAGIDGKLWESKASPNAAATYTENGTPLDFVWRTTLVPDNDQLAANQIIQSALGLTLPSTQALTVTAFDDTGDTLGLVSVSGNGDPGSIWNAFNWGAATWGAAITPFRQYELPWPAPLVFKQMAVQINGQSVGGLVIGNFYAKYQILGYVGAQL